MTDKLIKLLGENQVRLNENLKNYTTFKVGGPAKAVVYVNTLSELKGAIALLREEKEKYLIIGNGSNILVSDEGFDGVIIKTSGDFMNIDAEGDTVKAGCGVLLSRLCCFARDCSLSGLEFAYGIPGTVGGAMVMNAGAYDGEVKMVVESVDILEADGSVRTYSNAEMAFGYRDSICKHRDVIVLGATFKLKAGVKEEITAKMEDFMGRRKSKQPLEFPSAGSTFKRPEGYFAGKLIQDAGLAGKRVGGASVSAKHCGFIVNDKGGTASDISRLMDDVISCVKRTSGVTLVPEVIKVGKF